MREPWEHWEGRAHSGPPFVRLSQHWPCPHPGLPTTTLMGPARWESPDPGPLSPSTSVSPSVDRCPRRLSQRLCPLAVSTLLLDSDSGTLWLLSLQKGQKGICMECGRLEMAPEATGSRKGSPGWELHGWRRKQREGSDEPAQVLGAQGAGVWRMRGAYCIELGRRQQPGLTIPPSQQRPASFHLFRWW